MPHEPLGTLTYVFPAHVISGYGDWSCTRDYWRPEIQGLTCGCPECLFEKGLTLCWSAPDVDRQIPQSSRQHRIVGLHRVLDRAMVDAYVLPAYRYAANRFLKENGPEGV